MASAVDQALSANEIRLASRALGDGLMQTDLSVPAIHCGGCIRKIEQALGALDGVDGARVNLSTKRVSVNWRRGHDVPPLGETLAGLGFQAFLHEQREDGKDKELSRLVLALAVAGFASMNVMGLSVSVWSGAAGDTRDLFHWLSAAIALPTLAYSGRIFFQSAWRALRHGRTNMDVPISIGVLLAFGMSLYDTIHSQPHAYFDAAVSLLFFLLIGRTLDHLMRERARTAVKGLGRLAAYGATVIRDDGTHLYMPVEEIAPGMTILLPAGERVPADAVVIEGRSDMDCSLATGESAPETVQPGSQLRAGTLNLSGPLKIAVTAAAKDSFLAEMVRLMEAAESGRSGYRRLADRAASLYAPVVHLAAFLSFAGWMLATGDMHRSITIAVAVLIITCPCALGLAVPMVQVVAARLLYENGIMAKDGSAMERLAEVDTVLFDKTGTLTSGKPVLRDAGSIDPASLAMAAALAVHSRHPYSQALAAASAPADTALQDMAEHPGLGLEGRAGDDLWQLGRGEWIGPAADAADAGGTVLARNGEIVARFQFDDMLRPGAPEGVARLRERGYAIELISGDTPRAVAQTAAMLGIERFEARMLPAEKAGHVAALGKAGRKVLMVGDGLNDSAALIAAHVSIAPANAADIGRQAADFVFLRENLEAVPFAIRVSQAARGLIRQNFALSALYNAIALPVAVAGLVTPLIAALAMSLSSIVVVANALRLRPQGATRRAAHRRMTGGSARLRPLAARAAG